MKPITYWPATQLQNRLKLKSGLAPTGVLRQILVTTQQYSVTNIRPRGGKDKPLARRFAILMAQIFVILREACPLACEWASVVEGPECPCIFTGVSGHSP